MRTLADIPESVKQTFTAEEREALELLEPYAHDLKASFQDWTGEFDCIGFVGEENKVTKFANFELYNALFILENRVRQELSGQILEHKNHRCQLVER